MYLNNVTLAGRLTKDPELRYTPNGVAVANFTIAINRSFTNGQGEKAVDFIPVIVWRKPAENVSNYLKKGDLVGLTGRIQTRNYEGQDGRRVFVTEVIADTVQFGPKSSGNDQGNTEHRGTPQNGAGSQYGGFKNDPFMDGRDINITDEDLPF